MSKQKITIQGFSPVFRSDGRLIVGATIYDSIEELNKAHNKVVQKMDCVYVGYKQTHMTYYPISESVTNVNQNPKMKFNFGDKVKLILTRHPNGPMVGSEGVVFQRVGFENSPNCVNVDWTGFYGGWRRNEGDLATCWAVEEDQLQLIETPTDKEHNNPLGGATGLESGGSVAGSASSPSASASTLQVGATVKVVKVLDDDMLSHLNQCGKITQIHSDLPHPFEVKFEDGEHFPFAAEELEIQPNA